MAMGGMVQRFSEGSLEGAVEPIDEPREKGILAASSTGIPPAMIERMLGPGGLAALEKRIRERGGRTNTIDDSAFEKNAMKYAQNYAKILGVDPKTAQAQMLFDIAGAGLALAGNIDPRTGQPLRGSFASRLAGAASQLPAQIGARASDAEKMAQQINLLGIQSAEKRRAEEQAAILKREEQDIKLAIAAGSGEQAIELKQMEIAGRLAQERLRQKNKVPPPITEGQARSIVANPENLAAFAAGGMDQRSREVEEAVAVLTSPRFQWVINPQTDKWEIKEVPPGQLTNPVKQAIAARKKALSLLPMGQGTSVPDVKDQPPIPSTVTSPKPTTSVPDVKDQPPIPSTATSPKPTSTQIPQAAPYIGQTLFKAASRGTGPIALLGKFIFDIPLVGGVIDPAYTTSVNALISGATEISNALRETSRLSNSERLEINEAIDAFPKVVDRPEAYQTGLISLDNRLLGILKKAEKASKQLEIGSKKRQEAEEKINEIKYLRSIVGMPARFSTLNDMEAANLPLGTIFFLESQQRFAVSGKGN
jgi:hypothetical protein